MSHEIEVVNGRARFVGSRIPAWHGLGTVFERDVTVEEALTEAGLRDWHVRTAPVVAFDGEDVVTTTQYVATIRDNQNDPDAPAEHLGMVGPNYTVVQNEDAARFAEALLLAPGVAHRPNVSAAGSIKKGRQVFFTMEVPDHIEVRGDVTIPYLLAIWGHDGTTALNVQMDYIRAVCANTVGMALGRQTEMRYVVRHVGDIDLDAHLIQAGEALTLAYKSMDAFTELATTLVETDITDRQFEAIVKGLFPDPKEDVERMVRDRIDANRQTYRWLYADSPTQDNIRGTAWAAVQAAVEFSDWYRRGSDDTEVRARTQALNVDQRRFKENATRLAMRTAAKK